MKLNLDTKRAVVKYVTAFNLRNEWVSIDIPTFIESAEHYKCQSGYDFEQAMEWESYYDLYKSVYGVRPRWTHYKDKSIYGWQKTNRYLSLSKYH